MDLKWICKRKCYWRSRLWASGETFVGDAETDVPPHHFELLRPDVYHRFEEASFPYKRSWADEAFLNAVRKAAGKKPTTKTGG